MFGLGQRYWVPVDNGITVDWIVEEDVTELHDGPSNGVSSIIEDKDGCFWFSRNYRCKVYGDSIHQNVNADYTPFLAEYKE